MATSPTDNQLVCLGPVKRGRPESYTDDLANEICERIAAGETLRSICDDDHIPHISTVSKWLMRRPEFSQAYAHAREAQMHLETEDIREIADDLSILPDHKRIMIDARKWRAERLNRKTYGASVKHEHELTPATPNGAEQLPPGLAWLAGQLPEPEKKDGNEG